jgi:predicted GNAT family N-acyltransferase
MNGSIIVRKLHFGDPELEKAFEIRRKVFVEEQSCPPHLEYSDDDVSTHFLAYCDNFPCGAARWRKTANGIKLERFAVLPSYRGNGVGKQLVTAVLADIPADAGLVYLNAQLSALDFYVPFGFAAVGHQFEEAGIMHQQMHFSSGS